MQFEKSYENVHILFSTETENRKTQINNCKYLTDSTNGWQENSQSGCLLDTAIGQQLENLKTIGKGMVRDVSFKSHFILPPKLYCLIYATERFI